MYIRPYLGLTYGDYFHISCHVRLLHLIELLLKASPDLLRRNLRPVPCTDHALEVSRKTVVYR